MEFYFLFFAFTFPLAIHLVYGFRRYPSWIYCAFQFLQFAASNITIATKILIIIPVVVTVIISINIIIIFPVDISITSIPIFSLLSAYIIIISIMTDNFPDSATRPKPIKQPGKTKGRLYKRVD